MKARLAVVLIALTATACVQYLTSTNFYGLQRGITKQQFLDSWQRKTDEMHAVGGRPATSQAFRLGDDVWEVWIYNVYRIVPDGAVPDHQEYVAFKNDRLEEWGIGTLPLTLRDNPNRIDVHVQP
jgi:hypothetical protein